MTTEKFANIFRLQKLSLDEIRQRINDLDHSGLTRQERHMKRMALEEVKREKLKAT